MYATPTVAPFLPRRHHMHRSALLSCHARHGHYTQTADTLCSHTKTLCSTRPPATGTPISKGPHVLAVLGTHTSVSTGGSCTRPPVGRACRCTSHHHRPSAGATAGRRRLQEGKRRGSKKRGRQDLRLMVGRHAHTTSCRPLRSSYPRHCCCCPARCRATAIAASGSASPPSASPLSRRVLAAAPRRAA